MGPKKYFLVTLAVKSMLKLEKWELKLRLILKT